MQSSPILHLVWATGPQHPMECLWFLESPEGKYALPPVVQLDSNWILLWDAWLMIWYYMLCASLTAVMNWKSGGGVVKIYSFYLGNLPHVKGGINWARQDSQLSGC